MLVAPSLLLIITAAAPTPSDAGVVPSELIRRAAKGADRLEILNPALQELGTSDLADVLGGTPHPAAPSNRPEEVLLTITGEARIASLLAVLQTSALPPGAPTTHMCAGGPQLRFSKGPRALVEFSFDHVSLLSPPWQGLWAGDVDVPPAAARAMAAWFAREGFRLYQDELDDLDAEAHRWEAFWAPFPPVLRERLRALHEHREVPGGDGDPVASAMPDEATRLRTACLALSGLDGWWRSDADLKLVLASLARLSPATVVAVASTFPPEGPEARGLAWLLFGDEARHALTWDERLPRAAYTKLAARAAHASFRHGDRQSADARALPWWLERARSPEAEAELARHAGVTAKELEPAECQHDPNPAVPLGALLVLTGWRVASPEAVAAAGAHAWRCPANAAAARILVAIAGGGLPTHADLQGLDVVPGIWLVRRLAANPTREALDFAVTELLTVPLGQVRSLTTRWLRPLLGLPLLHDQAVSEDEDRRQVEAAWKKARPTWKPPAPRR